PAGRATDNRSPPSGEESQPRRANAPVEKSKSCFVSRQDYFCHPQRGDRRRHIVSADQLGSGVNRPTTARQRGRQPFFHFQTKQFADERLSGNPQKERSLKSCKTVQSGEQFQIMVKRLAKSEPDVQ